MKFFVSNDIKKEKNLRMMISGLSLFLMLFVLSDIVVKKSLFGSTPNQLSTTLLGDSENFIDPFSFNALLEMLHTDLFFIMLLFILSGALYFRIKPKSHFRDTLILSLLGIIVISLVSPFLALHYIWASTLWYYTFLTWHLLFLYIFSDIIFSLKADNAK